MYQLGLGIDIGVPIPALIKKGLRLAGVLYLAVRKRSDSSPD